MVIWMIITLHFPADRRQWLISQERTFSCHWVSAVHITTEVHTNQPAAHHFHRGSLWQLSQRMFAVCFYLQKRFELLFFRTLASHCKKKNKKSSFASVKQRQHFICFPLCSFVFHTSVVRKTKCLWDETPLSMEPCLRGLKNQTLGMWLLFITNGRRAHY